MKPRHLEQAAGEYSLAAQRLGGSIERDAIVRYLRKLPEGVALSTIAQAIEDGAHDPERAFERHFIAYAFSWPDPDTNGRTLPTGGTTPEPTNQQQPTPNGHKARRTA